MTTHSARMSQTDRITRDIAEEYFALADLLEDAGPQVWDAASLCEG